MATRDARPASEIVTWHGAYRTLKILGGPVAILTTDLTLGGVVILYTVPRGYTIMRQTIQTTQLDSSTGLTIDIGDTIGPGTTPTQRLLAASTGGQLAGGQNLVAAFPVVAGTPGGAGYRYPVDTPITFTARAAATTAVAGTFAHWLEGFIDA